MLELTRKNFELHIGKTTLRSLSVCVAKHNTEEEPELAARFGIRNIPTLMVFRNGKMLRFLLDRVIKSQYATLTTDRMVDLTCCHMCFEVYS